ncbi:acetyl-CoA decarbonylase/synthase complex subunit gamma [Methanolinea mesophila]|uniref:acetyl-CoA decarbonylase/synthase complex subunit gamma n=1 Tax=Methanolinea mesophila TaxID=547055 RepID=UPI001AE612A2|nr:acetyl-CoA decarbonylase/synthase complex subunit gamma [Methanolinea mesophila]MBP1928019.1 acetyl-CoA decarbonylase/synthase complex subunit gamma [Methanolinea mesophila]
MALKALDIYKLLPKKNCKECGDPTCLTFAMKLASGKGELEKCPYLDENARRVLGASTRPPVQKVKIGVGERSFTVGEEFVLFRHEKTFYHQPGFMLGVTDTMEPEEIMQRVIEVRDGVMVRVGMDLRLDGVAIRNVSRDPGRFADAVSAVESVADLPEVLISENPAALEAGLAICGHYRPLIHAADHRNYREFSALAKKYGAGLILRAPSLEAMSELSTLCTGEGVHSLLFDLSPGSLSEYLRSATLARQYAIARAPPPLGYPIYCDTTAFGDPEAALVLAVLKYGSVIVTDHLSAPAKRALLTLRQNIYTDPQKPIQITPGLYRVGNPAKDAPVLLTVNFSLTYFTLQGYLEAARVPCFMLVADTEGMSVLTSVAAGKLNETLVKDSLARFGVDAEVSHRTLIIPGYAAPLSGRIEEETGWKVLVGPRDAAEIAEFLEKEWKPTHA